MTFKEHLKTIFQSKTFLIVIYVILGIVVGTAIFAAGISEGLHQARYNQDWRNHYLQNFGPLHGIPPQPHGAIGKILSVQLPTITVEDRTNIEKTILVTDTTKIRDAHALIPATQLAPDEFIVVIGDPNTDGQIQARFIRIIPSPNDLQN